ncbi:Gfo/Idh/MocA family protein [Polymorphospora rubra]|uniref:Gfo/Idh/MocA family protein n=1 Tax=Polymorphospora rubra TaxID=338584 RepID=UPI0033D4B1EE
MGLRFGLFGTGNWAAKTHAPAIVGHPGAELVGVWGRDPAKAADLADRYGVRPYPDVDDLIADVDAVAVALPPDVQAPIAVRAAEAGRHLLLDKPLALDLAEADRVVDAVRRTGVASVLFFTNRFRSTVVDFLDRAVATGGWTGSRSILFASIFEPGSPHTGSTWRRRHGGLWDVGPHLLSLVVPVLGPVTQVAAMDAPDHTAHLLLRHAGGAASTMSLTVDGPPAARTNEVTFFGTAGLATVPAGDTTAVEALTAAVDVLLDEIATGARGGLVDVRFGRDVVAVLAAAELARTGAGTVPVVPAR